MAEVEIRGGGDLDGAVLRNAATEATLQELVRVLNKGGKSDSGNKAQDLFNKSIRNNVVVTNRSTNNLGVFNNTLSSLKKSTNALGQQFERLGNIALGGIFSGIATAGRALVGFFTNSVDSFRRTSDVGASFNNDLVELRRTAAASAMPLEMFAESVAKNSRILAAFGGSVTQGAQRFATLTRELRTGDIGTRFMGMGMTMSDLNDYMAEYLDLEMKAGRMEGKSDADLLQGTQNYIMELDKLSKITGLSRKEQASALRTAMTDGRLIQLQSRLSDEGLERFRSAVTLMQTNMDPQAMGTIINAMSGVIDPADSFGRMMAAQIPGFQSFNRAMGQGRLSTEEIAKGAEDQIAAIDRQLAGMSDQQIARNADLTRMRQYQQSLRALARANTADARAEQLRRARITEGLTSFSQAIEKIKGDVLLAFIDSGVFKKVEEALAKIAQIFDQNKAAIGNAIVNFANSILGFLQNVQSKGLGEALKDVFKNLFNAIPFRAIGGFVLDLAKDAMVNLWGLIKENAGRAISAALGIIIAAKLGILAGPFTVLAAALAGIFGVDVVAGWLEKGWKAIKNLGTSIANLFSWNTVSQFFTNAWNTISGIPTKILEFFNVDSVGQLFGNAWNTISGIPTKIRELFSLENLNLPKISDLFNSLVSTVRGFFNFDFQLPNIRDFLPTWLGGTGRARTEIADVQQNRAEPNTTSRDQSRTVDNADARVREYRARLANARLTNIPDTTTTGDDLTLDYLKYPETGRPPPGATSLAMPQAPETSNRINTEELSTQVASTNRELIAALNVLKEHLDKLSTGNSETAASLTNIVSPLASTLGTVTNTMIEEQRKLNTMIAELRPVFEATRDSTKNVADNVGGRNSPL